MAAAQRMQSAGLQGGTRPVGSLKGRLSWCGVAFELFWWALPLSCPGGCCQ